MGEDKLGLKQLKVAKKGNKLAKRSLHATNLALRIAAASLVATVAIGYVQWNPQALDPVWKFVNRLIIRDPVSPPGAPGGPLTLDWSHISASENPFRISDVITKVQYAELENSKFKYDVCPLQERVAEVGDAKVTWHCANIYAKWLSVKAAANFSLPSMRQLAVAKDAEPSKFTGEVGTEWSKDCVSGPSGSVGQCSRYRVFEGHATTSASPGLANTNGFRLVWVR